MCLTDFFQKFAVAAGSRGFRTAGRGSKNRAQSAPRVRPATSSAQKSRPQSAGAAAAAGRQRLSRPHASPPYSSRYTTRPVSGSMANASPASEEESIVPPPNFEQARTADDARRRDRIHFNTRRPSSAGRVSVTSSVAPKSRRQRQRRPWSAMTNIDAVNTIKSDPHSPVAAMRIKPINPYASKKHIVGQRKLPSDEDGTTMLAVATVNVPHEVVGRTAYVMHNCHCHRIQQDEEGAELEIGKDGRPRFVLTALLHTCDMRTVAAAVMGIDESATVEFKVVSAKLAMENVPPWPVIDSDEDGSGTDSDDEEDRPMTVPEMIAHLVATAAQAPTPSPVALAEVSPAIQKAVRWPRGWEERRRLARKALQSQKRAMRPREVKDSVRFARDLGRAVRLGDRLAVLELLKRKGHL